MTFDENFIWFFDEPKRAINSEAKTTENEGDELLKIVDDAINDIQVQVEGGAHNLKFGNQVVDEIVYPNDIGVREPNL